jgi:hypothetical protein
MELRDISERGQLAGYYEENGLTTTEAKVDHLMDAMRVKAVQCEHGSEPENVLLFLEGCALVGSWKGYL